MKHNFNLIVNLFVVVLLVSGKVCFACLKLDRRCANSENQQ